MNIKTANRLCELRKAHNLSQEELASKLGVSRQAVSKWERSESSPDTDNLVMLASIYGITIDELINGEEVMPLNEENKVSTPETILLDKNTKATICDDNITIIKEDKEKTFSISETLKWNDNVNKHAGIITAVTAITMVITYLLLGFTISGWGEYWFLFILIPVPESIYHAIKRGELKKVNIVCIITSLYCALGMLINFFHPGWVLFFIIPIFYTLAGFIYNKDKAMLQNVIDAYYKLHPDEDED